MISFDPIAHEYKVDGIVKPSVTQVMNRVAVRKDEKSPWRSVTGSEFCDYEDARKFGTECHEVCKYKMKNIPCTYDPVLEPRVIGLNKFMTDYHLHPENKWMYNAWFVEKSIYSKLGYAGTYDLFIGSLDFELKSDLVPKDIDQYPENVLVDWKTSTSISKCARMQTAAYVNAVKENYKLRNGISRWTVRLFENDYEIEERTNKDYAEDWNKFLSLLNVYKTFSK